MKNAITALSAALLLAAATFLLTGADVRQQGKVVLTGKVEHKNTQRPIEGATLKVYQIIDGPDMPLIDTARTDSKGEYAMNIPLGQRFRLTTDAPGMESSAAFVSTENMDTRSFGAVVKQDVVLGPKVPR